MAVMKCPKCGGSGKEWPIEAFPQTTATPTWRRCTSCAGKGYVTDKEA